MLELKNISLQVDIDEIIQLAREEIPPIILSAKDALKIVDIFKEAMLGNIQDELEFAFDAFNEAK